MISLYVVPRKFLKFIYLRQLIYYANQGYIYEIALHVSRQLMQGRRKLPQSGWARPRTILLLVKSGWANIPFH